MHPSSAFAVLASSSIAAAVIATTVLGTKPAFARSETRPRCPAEMALAGGVCVDRWEASLVEIDGGVERPHSPFEPVLDHAVKAVSRPGVVPQAHVSMIDAKRACANAGKRLCRKDEWVAACKGPAQTKYPYGDRRVPGACVDTGRTAPLAKYYREEQRYTARAMNDPRLNQTPNTVAKAGEATACTNGFGVHDMVGNLHEWVDDGAFHGGYYLDTRINREGCDYATTAHTPDYYDYSTGFRCCADPETKVADATPEPVAPPPQEESPARMAQTAPISITTTPGPLEGAWLAAHGPGRALPARTRSGRPRTTRSA
jgi:hypothetical protein